MKRYIIIEENKLSAKKASLSRLKDILSLTNNKDMILQDLKDFRDTAVNSLCDIDCKGENFIFCVYYIKYLTKIIKDIDKGYKNPYL